MADDPILEDLRSEGTVDSRGTFTVDPAGLRKLREHRFQDPHVYVLPLLSSAVLAGATRVDIRNDWDELELFHDGAPPTREELERALLDLEPSLARTPGGRLALALQAASTLALEALTVETWDGREGLRAVLHPEGPRVEALSEAPWKQRTGTRVYVKEPGGWRLFREFTRHVVLGDHPESCFLRTQGFLAPPAVNVHLRAHPWRRGKRLNPPFDMGKCSAWSLLEGPVELPLAPPQAWLDRRGPSPGPFTALVTLDARPSAAPYTPMALNYKLLWEPDAAGTVLAVVDGVCWVHRRLDLGDGVFALVAAPDLEVDLSWTGVVQDERWEALIQAVRQEADDLVDAMVDQWHQEGGREPRPPGPWLERLSDHLRVRGRMREFLPVLQEQVRAAGHQGGDYGTDDPLQLAVLLCWLGRAGEAVEVLQDLRKVRGRNPRYPSSPDILSPLALAHFETGDLEAAEKAATAAWRQRARESRGSYGGFTTYALPHLEPVLDVLVEAGRPEEAAREWSEARDRMGRLNKAGPRAEDAYLDRLAWLHLAVGDRAAARHHAHRSIERLEEQLRWADDPAHGWGADSRRDTAARLGSALALAGVAALEEGDAAAAAGLANRAVDLHARILGEDHLETAGSRVLRAAARRDPRELEECLDGVRRGLGPNHPEVARLLVLRAFLGGDAEGSLGEARTVVDESLPGGHPFRVQILEFLAFLAWKSGDRPRAAATWRDVASRPGPPPGPLRLRATVNHRGWFTATFYWPKPNGRPLRLDLPAPETSRLPEALDDLAAGPDDPLARRSVFLRSWKARP